MSETKKVLLILPFMVAFVGGGIVWFGVEAADVSATTWVLRVVFSLTTIGTLTLLIWGMTRRDKAPDFLRRMFGAYFERNGLCFAIDPIVIEGVFAFKIWFQNKYDRRCTGRVLISPSRDFFLRKQIDHVLHVGVEVGPGALLSVIAPFAIPESAQGKSTTLSVSADVDYPEGKGKLIRFRDGMTTGAIRGKIDLIIDAIGPFVLQSYKPASLKLVLPKDVAAAVPDGCKPKVETLWQIGEDVNLFDSDRYRKSQADPTWERSSGITLRPSR
ncbi:MAG: hypothetical protein M0R80_17765 [Proteobacteria bacterium]|jgi:hypothetical protein|nr:hypothetical protein [Pseudomonadota bacterium]